MVHFEKLIKAFSVLCHINAVSRCSEDIYAVVAEVFCKLNSCLTAEGNNNAIWLFCVDNAHNIFICEWLKIKSVGCIEVCRNCFRVVIYDNNIKASLFQCPYAVNGGIVKFDALTDSDRA